jgi:hypothetical protein
MNNATSIPPSAESVQPQVKRLSFYWSPNKQRFSCDEVVSEGHGPICTDPSHDLVHLIVAANGNLPWLPHGDRDLVCFAEYNAVLLENLFDKTCNAIAFGTSAIHETLVEAFKYMDWFVGEHYAPFPTSNRVAFSRFCQQINPLLVTQLFPYYFYVKRYERTQSNYREAEYQIDFTSGDRPPVDELGWVAQWSIYRQLKAARVALGLQAENPALGFRIEQALEKIDQLGEITARHLVEPRSRCEAGSLGNAPESSELEALKRRLSAVETQLKAVNSVLFPQLEANPEPSEC